MALPLLPWVYQPFAKYSIMYTVGIAPNLCAKVPILLLTVSIDTRKAM
jgi:hypothetical protein